MMNALMALLAPVNCLQCGTEGAVICTTCMLAVGSKTAACFGCLSENEGWKTCLACRERSDLAGVSVGAPYDGAVKELVWRLKFHRLRAAVEVAAELVMREAASWPELEMVTAVPVAAGRYRERGYNQSELLARAVAQRCGLPYRPLLERNTTTHQIGLDRRSRFRQIQGAFYAVKRLDGQRVLVVDDVVTTGATLSECAEVLRRAGAGEVWAAAVARN